MQRNPLGVVGFVARQHVADDGESFRATTVDEVKVMAVLCFFVSAAHWQCLIRLFRSLLLGARVHAIMT